MIERIGSLRSKRVDVRIIAATNGELEKAVANGEFRSDLYYRIKVFTINLPPLRERAEDKVTLANYFFKKITQEEGWCCKGFTPEALDCIRQHPWPGNVRELSNRIRRAVVVQEDWIRPEDLEITRSHSLTKNLPFRMATQKLKKDMIESALRERKYNVSQTARSLGMSRPYLYTLTKKLGIQISRR
jgi:transcriptional regulator with GAF, ATPase, and Fis domain